MAAGSGLEQNISRSLIEAVSALPNGASIPDSELFQHVLTGLGYLVPVFLAEIYQEWRFQGLDGIYPVVSRKTGEGEVEILGTCCFVEDQTLAPIHLHFQATHDEISWLECRLGELGTVRVPYSSLKAENKRLYFFGGRIDLIDWAYKVTFGHRRLQPSTEA